MAGSSAVEASTAGIDPGFPGSSTAALSAQPGSMYSIVNQIGARAAWRNGVTGRGVNVAVIDTGIMPVPALAEPDKVVAVVDLSTDAGLSDERYLDAHGHGTHMSGIIAGRDPEADPATAGANPQQFLGVAPDAGLVSVKVGNSDGTVDPSQVIAAIDWVLAHRAELKIGVLNLSFSSDSIHTYLTDPLDYAVERAWRAGIVVVAAAGNDGGRLQLTAPANDPFVIAVGAVAASSSTGGFSAPSWSGTALVGRSPDLAAPGVNVVSLRSEGSRLDQAYPIARQGDWLFRGSGSSQAAAVVAGAAALVRQAHPEFTPDQVKDVLIATANPNVSGQRTAYGAGVIRVDRAIVAAPRPGATQTHLPSTGTGSLDGLRGITNTVSTLTRTVGGLVGTATGGTIDTTNLTLLGNVYDVNYVGAKWTNGRWDGVRWSDGSWNGVRWTNSSFSGVRWSGEQWSAATWSGLRWTGVRWSGVRWSGVRWSGVRWSGVRWSSASWSGVRWSAGSWG